MPPADELSQVAIEGLDGYFRSHPETTERLAQANRIIEEDGLDKSRPLLPLFGRYKTAKATPKQDAP
jgi:hypothetical protein